MIHLIFETFKLMFLRNYWPQLSRQSFGQNPVCCAKVPQQHID